MFLAREQKFSEISKKICTIPSAAQKSATQIYLLQLFSFLTRFKIDNLHVYFLNEIVQLSSQSM